MEPLRKLEKFVAEIEFDSKAANQDHRDIYTYIEEVILSPQSPFLKHLPTLDIIIYSIKNILYPTLANRRIPELLDLLAMVEFYRGHTIDHANNAIVWNDYYRNDQGSTVTLRPQEETFLKNLEFVKDDLRKIYITILCICCHIDMYNLWTVDPPSLTDFLIRFNEYFPSLNDQYTEKSPLLHHASLSKEEVAQLADIGLTCCQFARETVEWMREFQDNGGPIHGVFRTVEFRKAFPSPCDNANLLSLIEYYLASTTSAAKTIKRMFSIQGEN